MKANRKKPQAAPRPSADKKREGAAPRLSRHAGRITAASVFLLFFLFSTMVYGDMLRRTAEANFITADSEQMKHLTDQTLGYLYVAGRWALLAFKNVWAGGALLALVLTLTALGANRLMGRKLGAWGAGAVVPAAVVGWMLWRGTNLWFRNEPSLFILLAVAAMLAVGAALLVKRLVVGRKAVPEPAGKGLRGLVVPVAAVAALSSAALTLGDNDIRTARMQLATMRGDWEALVDDGLAARRPTRAVAAYYAIGLAQTDQLLTRLFDIPYDYPDARIDRGTSGGSMASSWRTATTSPGCSTPVTARRWTRW